MRKSDWVAIGMVGAALTLTRCSKPQPAALPSAAPDPLVLTSLRSQAYRLSAGGLTLLPFKTDRFDDDSRPAISPDRRWISFAKSGEAWIYDVAGGRAYQATHFARPETAKLLSVEVLSLGWSADSRRFLVNVVPGPEPCDDCAEQHQPAPAQYGYYSYAPAERLLSPVSLPHDFAFRAWLPDGRFLGIVGRETACSHGSIANCGTLVIVQDGSAKPQVIAGFNGAHTQISISPSGKSAVTSDPDLGDDRSDRSQIIRIDFAGGHGQWLTPVGERGEYQLPHFSPDGQHVGWLWYRRPLNGLYYVVLDGNNIFSCGEISFDFQWLDSRRLAVECGPNLTVIDLSGKPLMRAAIPK